VTFEGGDVLDGGSSGGDVLDGGPGVEPLDGEGVAWRATRRPGGVWAHVAGVDVRDPAAAVTAWAGRTRAAGRPAWAVFGARGVCLAGGPAGTVADARAAVVEWIEARRQTVDRRRVDGGAGFEGDAGADVLDAGPRERSRRWRSRLGVAGAARRGSGRAASRRPGPWAPFDRRPEGGRE